MLSQFQFKHEMKRMADAFGESQKEKFDRQMDAFFEMLETRMSDEQLANTIDFIIRSGDRFPTIRDILEASRNFPDPLIRYQGTDCQFCESTGILKARQKVGNIEYSAVFKCPECQNSLQAYPVWTNDFKQKGYRLDLRESGWSATDLGQLRGLLIQGEDSRAWKRAPEAVQKAAKELAKTEGNKWKSSFSDMQPVKSIVSVDFTQSKNENEYKAPECPTFDDPDLGEPIYEEDDESRKWL